MKLTRDEPGQLVVLEEATASGRRTGPLWFWGIGLALSLFLLGRLLLGQEPSAFRTIVLLLPIWAFLVVLSGTLWRVRLLRIDAQAGELRVVEGNPVAWRDRETRMGLAEIGGLDVLTKRFSAEVIVRGLSGSTRKLQIFFGGTLTQEERAHIGRSLAAAAGLFYQRLVVQDPPLVHFRRAAAPGLEPLPTRATRHDAADARSPMSTSAGPTAGERTVAFNPTQFPSDHKITEWSPGQAIRFQKPMGAPTLGCLPVGLAALAMGPATFLSMRRASTGDALLFGGAVGFFGVILAALPLWIAYTELPRLVLVDWTTRTLAIRRGFERTGIAFADITALELQRAHREHLRNNSPETAMAWHRCTLYVHVRGSNGQPAKQVELVRGNEYKDDADTPYREALPLVTDLAAALGVPKRVTDHHYRA